MDHKAAVPELTKKLLEGESSLFSQRIILYSTGVLAKLLNAEFALKKIKDFANQSDSVTSTVKEDFTINEKIHFYVDSFFAFLFSAFDVTGQVINQKLRLKIDERKVGIKKIQLELENKLPNHLLNAELKRLFNTNHFINLDKYRNCSTHRRQIYLKIETVTIEGTPGYNATDKFAVVNRTLCDDPFSINPKTNQNRELVTYCSELYDKLTNEIIKIFKKI